MVVVGWLGCHRVRLTHQCIIIVEKLVRLGVFTRPRGYIRWCGGGDFVKTASAHAQAHGWGGMWR